MAGPERPRVSQHAADEIARRGLSGEELQATLQHPEEVVPLRSGRVVYQRRFPGEAPSYLIRVFVDTDRTPPVVVTAYKTTKIAKYWGRS
jgi:hypothetical protein